MRRFVKDDERSSEAGAGDHDCSEVDDVDRGSPPRDIAAECG
jgi:hypothetical protein